MNRDPIGEMGFVLAREHTEAESTEQGMTLYLFCANAPQSHIDFLGLTWNFGAWRFSLSRRHPLTNVRVQTVANHVVDILRNLDISIQASGIRFGVDSYRPWWRLVSYDLLDGSSRLNVDGVLGWLTGPIQGSNMNLPGGQQVIHIFRQPMGGIYSSALGYTPGGVAGYATDRVSAFSAAITSDEDLAIIIVHEILTHARLDLNHFTARGAQWNSRGITAATPLIQIGIGDKKKIHCSLVPALEQKGAHPSANYIISN